ncbi:MAG: hypothetical protein K9M07_00790 [Simkaniaceae bacterium]|nr:hypothetical protein [Simkaniaceae bacterium]
MAEPIEGITEISRRKSLYSATEYAVHSMDDFTLSKLQGQSIERRETHIDNRKLLNMISSLNQSLEKIKDGTIDKDAFYTQYREGIEEITAIWEKYREEFGYILKNSDDLFIPLSSDHSTIIPQAVEQTIANCNALSRSLESVKLPELDVLLTQTLEMNTLLLKAMGEIVKQAGRTFDRMVANQIPRG